MIERIQMKKDRKIKKDARADEPTFASEIMCPTETVKVKKIKKR